MSEERGQFSERLEALKQAVAMLEQTAAQESAEHNAQASAERAEAAQLAQSLLTLRQFLREASKDRPELRESIRHLSNWLAEVVTASPQDSSLPGAEASALGVPAISAPPEPLPIVLPPPQQEVPLTIGNASMVINVPGTTDEAQAAKQAAERIRNEGWSAVHSAPISAPPSADMAMVVTRCAIKAEGCDWAAQYREAWETDPIDQTMRKASYESIISRARALPNCYVWATNPKLIIPDSRRMLHYAQAYRNLGTAADLAHSVKRDGPHGGDWTAEAYSLLAEAQSALRAALEVDGLYTDTDQEEVFRWLRTRTSEDRILVPRHMKLEDPGDIAEADDLAARLNDLRLGLAAIRQQGSQKRSMLSKAKYHARLLRENQSDEAHTDWRKLIDAISAAVEKGVPPSDVEIRDILAPLIDQVPDDLEYPAGFERVLEAVDVYVATREAEGAEPPKPRAASREVAEVAALLDGQVAVLIGGEVRAESKRALERDLHLAELRWIPAAHHQSHYLFESAVARPDTAVVMLAIRWSSHAFENVDELCRKYGKPYVRLPGGYSPNQVAKQILEQVGDTLRRNRGRTTLAK